MREDHPEFRARLQMAKDAHLNMEEYDPELMPLQPQQKVQFLPVQVVGDPATSTHLMGFDKFVGTRTVCGTWAVEKAAANFATRIDVEGITAKAQGFSVVVYRSMDLSPPPDIMCHDGQGNQYLLLTLYKAGVVEWQIGMGNSTHLAE
jgi:hypothetical protein